MDVPIEFLQQHHVAVDSDRPWQRLLRLMQAMWREDVSLPIGTHISARRGSRKLGSRIAMPHAQEELANYLTETIREVVRNEVGSEGAKAAGKLYSEPRIYDDLLSSQPLCFNLFAELKADRDHRLASSVARHLWPGRVTRITRIEFEHSPGRGDAAYTGNRSAFDVYLEHDCPDGGRGFIGIEVKYHENLVVKQAENRTRTDQVAEESGVFASEELERLRKPPLQQIWFDHLLALSMRSVGEWDRGLFVFLHPAANQRCHRVVDDYERTLVDAETFQRLTLEELVAVLRLYSSADWIAEFHRRYLDYPRALAAAALS